MGKCKSQEVDSKIDINNDEMQGENIRSELDCLKMVN